MRRLGIALLALALLAVVFAATPAEQANAQTSQTLVSTLAQPKGTSSTLHNKDQAQAFTTGSAANGYTVTGVDIEFSQVDRDDLETVIVVTVNADSGGEPGAVVDTLTNPDITTGTDEVFSFTHAGLELDGATTYWLVVGSDSTVQMNNRIRHTLSDSEDVSVDGWRVANTRLDRFGGGSWISRNYAMLVQIRGTPTLDPSLVSNFGQANGGTGSLVAHDHAQAFTTGSNARGYDLTAIDLQFPAVGDGALASKLTVTVNEDSGGAPGAVVATLTKPATMTTGANSFTHAGLRLAANTTYWVVLDVTSAPSGTNTIRNTASDAEDAGAAPGFSIADDAQWRNRGGGSWTTFGLSRKINVRGAANVTQTFVSNLGQSDDGHVSLDNDVAQAFTTGSNSFGYSLRSVDVEFNAIQSGFSSSDLTASIHTDSSGSPGSSLGALTNPASFPVSSADQTLTFTSAGIDLAANTSYFLVIDMSVNRDSSSVNNTLSDNEDSGALPGWSIGHGYSDRSFSSTGGWGTSPSESISISLGGVSKTRTPEVAITGDGGVTEGDSASFTLTASPAPAEALRVSVTVTTSGDFGFGARPTSVTIPYGQTSATLTIATSGDSVDELDGSVTVTLVDGAAYDLGATATATVKVRDDDPPLVSNRGQHSSDLERIHLPVPRAQGFTTGPNPGVLTSVDVEFQRSTEDFSSRLTVTLNVDDGNGLPGAVVATLDNPDWVNRHAGTYRFTHRGVPLEANTEYWVVFTGNGLTNQDTLIDLTQSDSEDVGALPGWSIHDEAHTLGSSGWIEYGQGYAMQIGVNGRLVPNSDGSYTVPFDWPLKPPGVGGGGEFRLLFITDDWRDATSSDIDVYDAFVQGAALGGHAAIKPYAGKFRVVGSTAAVDARDHTRTNPSNAGHPDVSIFWLNGQRVAQNNAGFWSSTWENWALPDRRFETGQPDTDSDWPWTGTLANGAKHSTNHLGIPGAGGPVVRGRFWSADGDTGPIQHTQVDKAQDHAFYGISPLFRVASTVNAPPQEPATLSNLEMPDGGAHDLTSDRAVSFTTGNNGGHYVLSSVDLSVVQVTDAGVNQALTVQVLGDSGGNPSYHQVLATLTNPAMQVSSTERTYTFSYDGDDGAGLRLAPNTRYWVAMLDRTLVHANSIRFRSTASASERLQGLPVGWSIGNDGRRFIFSSSTWTTQSEPLKIGLNLGAADPFVQFRTCEGTVSGNSCSTGWVTANYTKYDPPPTIELMEGGAAVTYQWRAVDPRERRYHYVAGQVVEPRSHFGGYIGAGGPDRDRLICHTGMDTTRIGDPIVYVPPQAMVVGIGYGSTAGPLLDRHDGCPFAVQSIYEHDPNKWRPLSVAAGQDSDAFDHTTFLILEPYSVGHWFHNDEGEAEYAAGFGYPEARLPLIIRDDDEWENDIVISVDNGTTWTSIEDGGLDLAFPRSLNNGFGGQNYAHRFWVRLKNDPSTITGAPASKRFSVIAHAPPSPISSGTQAEFEAYYVCLRSPAADELHTFNPDTCSGGGSAEVSYTPIQVEIHVGVSVTGSIRFEVEGYHLYERWDTQISTETPKKRVRTKSFNFDRTLGSCVGCQLLPGALPDPVVERVGDLTYANLSDTGIDLSWPRVVGAEGYQVRYWSTTSPFPGVSPEEAWFGAEPSEPAWNIRHLEPETEYRAVVYYQDHGATQLSTASPVIRFTTLAAGAPVEAEPTSVIVERVPEVSISAASGRITEGEDATFTVTVDPAPDAPLDVKVHVVAPAAGDVVNRQHLGTRTVNVSTTGSATFTIPTVDDASWDANGMLGATVDFGDGYRRSAFGSFASVNIRNNDLPPPPLVQLKGLSDTTMTVAWKPQGDGASYLVVWHKAYSGIPVLSEVTTTATEYEITGLEPNSHYTLSVLHGTNQLRTMTVRTLAAGATAKTFEVNFETPAPNTSVPVISVTSDGDVTEGADASFTVTANPAPDADLDVSVTVSATGDYGAATGQRTVTIPTAGYVALAVATTGDDVDETNGSVTVTVDPDADHDDYLVSTTQGAATVAVADDDDPQGADYTDYQTVVDLLIEVRDNPPNPAMRNNPAHVKKWNRVLAAVGYDSGESAMPASEVHDNAARWPDSPFHAASVYLTSLEQPRGQGQQQTPEISVTGGTGITEGGDAVFTVTASPAPAADLDVSVTVSQSGDYGATTGQRTVTVSTGGIVSFAVGTTDDSADETDGSVTATVDTGAGYTVSSTQGAATVSVSDNDDAPTPEISVSGGNGITEGGDAIFTVTASPAPASNLDVSVTISQSGDYGATTGARTVTIPTSGSVTLTVGTTDDTTDETDGSVTATVNAGTGYTVSSSQGSATVAVSDDDDPQGPDHTDYQTVVDILLEVRDNPPNPAMRNNPAHVKKWNRVLAAVGYDSGESAMPASEVHDNAARWPDSPFKAASDYLRSQENQGQLQPQTPEVSVTAGNGVTEGGDAVFTVTASPAPSSNLAVSVTVSQSGDYGATTGQRTVTIPTSGSVTLTVGTTDDTTDETDGSVTATVNAGSGYTVSASQGAATVAVSDNDDAPTPEVSVSGGNGVTEGGSAVFTVTASPAPASNLDVSVTVSQSGDYGATTGQRTVTIPTSGSVTLTVGTTDDTTDETDGSVTATVNAGSGYTVSSSQGAATVAVSDNDDAPTPVISVISGNGITEGGDATFTVTASPAPAANLGVSVTVSQSGDYGATTGQRTVTIPTSGSVTLTVATTDDTTDETDGSVTATVNAGSGYTVSSSQGAATVAVSDNDDAPTPVVEETDEAVLADCGDSRPTVLINNPTASRSDATVEFEVSLDCKPSGSVTLLLSVLRNGEISSDPVTYAALDGEETSITVTVEIRDSQELGLTLAWSSGVANRTETTGNVEFTD